ncbi:MAG: hypothetical protein KJO79_08680 [Verrucomicrobiae bacterium]|nr:hypothetical protein [Verrucomicrobiae bacterium]NNJ87241.1 hypothetical protein [Akkermansiaceae bacterium]
MSINLTLRLIPFIAFMGVAGALPLSAGLLFHEGFDDATGSLDGTDGWTSSGINVESSTTWLSWLSMNLDSRHAVVAPGQGEFNDRAGSATGQNIGAGSKYNVGGNTQPSYWDPDISSGVHQLGDATSLPANTPLTYLLHQ